MPAEDPPFESGTIARVRDALTGGTRALARDRDLAAYLASRFPGLGEMVRVSRDFHRRAALWAVSGAEVLAASVLFAAAGLPGQGRPLHADAAEAAPGTRFCYADRDAQITGFNRAVLADPGRVTVMTAPAVHPGELLAAPQAKELLALGPVSVHVLGAMHFWPADLARAAVAGYGKLLPHGSSLCLSWVLVDPTPQGRELADMMGLAGVTVSRHLPGDVEAWLKAGGFVLHPQKITDARAFAAPFAEPSAGPRPPMRVMEAVAIVRLAMAQKMIIFTVHDHLYHQRRIARPIPASGDNHR